MILKIILTIFTLTFLGYVAYTFYKADGKPEEKIKNVLDHTVKAWEGHKDERISGTFGKPILHKEVLI